MFLSAQRLVLCAVKTKQMHMAPYQMDKKCKLITNKNGCLKKTAGG